MQPPVECTDTPLFAVKMHVSISSVTSGFDKKIFMTECSRVVLKSVNFNDDALH